MTVATAAADATTDTSAEIGAAPETREEAVARIVRNNMYWSMGAGVIPVAFLDTAAVMGVQLKMLKELSDLYEVPFSANAGKSAVGALLASVSGGFLGQKVLTETALRTLVRRTPVIGPLIGLATMPAFYAAFTYGIGKVFEKHFESGGTLLSFNAKKAEPEFKDAFEEGKEKAAKSGSGSKSAS